VVERPRADARVRVADAPEPVGVVAEEVRVDRPDPQPALDGVRGELGPVVDPVPRDVERNRGAAAGQAMDERGVVDALPGGSRGAGPGVDMEARAGVPVAPRGRLDLERRQLLEQEIVVHAGESDAFATRFRLLLRRFSFRNIGRRS
jgi:hypothetical protein